MAVSAGKLKFGHQGPKQIGKVPVWPKDFGGIFGTGIRGRIQAVWILMFTFAHVEAVLRGWYPGWLAQLRAWSTETVVLMSILMFMFIRTVLGLYSK